MDMREKKEKTNLAITEIKVLVKHINESTEDEIERQAQEKFISERKAEKYAAKLKERHGERISSDELEWWIERYKYEYIGGYVEAYMEVIEKYKNTSWVGMYRFLLMGEYKPLTLEACIASNRWIREDREAHDYLRSLFREVLADEIYLLEELRL